MMDDLSSCMKRVSLDRVSRHSCRSDYLQWNDFFMASAYLAAQRSKDPSTQVGACIVNKDNIIVATGYNGLPNGCSDQKFPWSKKRKTSLDSKFLYVCHAEVNAIMNRNCSNLKQCRIFVCLFPCNECAKVIIQSGIREVIYDSDENSHKIEVIAAKRMFVAADVKYKQHTPKIGTIRIDFRSKVNTSLDLSSEESDDSDAESTEIVHKYYIH